MSHGFYFCGINLVENLEVFENGSKILPKLLYFLLLELNMREACNALYLLFGYHGSINSPFIGAVPNLRFQRARREVRLNSPVPCRLPSRPRSKDPQQ